MGKRSNFDRRPRDFYPTPIEAVRPLVPHLPRPLSFVEPCAGDGRMVEHLRRLTDVDYAAAFDVEPASPSMCDIERKNALYLTDSDVARADLIITNPPWSRDKMSGYLLHSLIYRFVDLRPTWLLFDADWMHTKQASEIITRHLVKVVSVGRVSWEQNGTSGKDNVCWYLFQKHTSGRALFYPR